MGQASSTPRKGPNPIDPKPEENVGAKGSYKSGYLKRRWKGTDRDGYRYSIGYSPSSTATCRCGCSQKIPKGTLRIGRSAPSPFDAEGGHADFTRFFLFEHAFGAFERSRCSSRVPLKQTDMDGMASIHAADKRRVVAAVAAFAGRWKAKCSSSTTDS